jgi:hypothetical protein
LATLPHVPSLPLPFFAAVQAWQVPKHQLSQHTPSAQNPDAHCAADVHAVPLAAGVCAVWQAPEPLHWLPVHSLSGSAFDAMLPHTPLDPLPFFAAEHAWHELMQMLLQQNPSTQ